MLTSTFPPSFLDILILSCSFGVRPCALKLILFLSSICLSSSFVHFREGPEYVRYLLRMYLYIYIYIYIYITHPHIFIYNLYNLEYKNFPTCFIFKYNSLNLCAYAGWLLDHSKNKKWYFFFSVVFFKINALSQSWLEFWYLGQWNRSKTHKYIQPLIQPHTHTSHTCAHKNYIGLEPECPDVILSNCPHIIL